jgi:phage gpG-like protein
MIGLKLRVSGIDNMKKKLAAAAKRGGNNVEFAEYVAARAYKECMKHFEEERGPEGKWEPLKPVTLARRRKGPHGGSAKILQDTGRLRASILFRGFKNKALVFTNMIYGAVHQMGFKQIPARPYLWVGDEFLDKMGKAYAKFIKGDLS